MDLIRRFVELQRNGRHTRPLESNGKEQETTKCKNCETEFSGKYCPNCGQEAKVGRLTMLQGANDLIGIFTNFDTGFMHTCLELCYRPGYMIRDYINGHRKEYIKPIQLLFLLTTIMLIIHYLLYGGNYANVEWDIEKTDHKQLLETIKSVVEWFSSNQAMLYLVMVALLVLPNKLCFNFTEQGKKMNIAEHFFTMVYVACQIVMIRIVMIPIEWLSGESDNMSLGVPLLLLIWDFHQLCEIGFRKSTFLCLLSNFITWGLVIAVGTIAVIVSEK